MKITHGAGIGFTPASHEDPKDPGCLKKVLLSRDDLPNGRLQMVNWSFLPKGRSFRRHYHDSLEEVFLIVKGKAEVEIEGDKQVVLPEDLVIVPAKAKHSMIALEDTCYVAIGVVTAENGKTVVVEE